LSFPPPENLVLAPSLCGASFCFGNDFISCAHDDAAFGNDAAREARNDEIESSFLFNPISKLFSASEVFTIEMLVYEQSVNKIYLLFRALVLGGVFLCIFHKFSRIRLSFFHDVTILTSKFFYAKLYSRKNEREKTHEKLQITIHLYIRFYDRRAGALAL